MKNFKLTELDKILLRRKHLVMFEPADMAYEQGKTEKALVVSGLKNVQALGFTFSKELLESEELTSTLRLIGVSISSFKEKEIEQMTLF